MLLEVSGLTTRYGVIAALRDASLSEVLAQTDLLDTFVRGSAA